MAQDKLHIDVLYRDSEGKWYLQAFDGADDEVSLPCPDMQLSLGAIYEGVGL